MVKSPTLFLFLHTPSKSGSFFTHNATMEGHTDENMHGVMEHASIKRENGKKNIQQPVFAGRHRPNY